MIRKKFKIDKNKKIAGDFLTKRRTFKEQNLYAYSWKLFKNYLKLILKFKK